MRVCDRCGREYDVLATGGKEILERAARMPGPAFHGFCSWRCLGNYAVQRYQETEGAKAPTARAGG